MLGFLYQCNQVLTFLPPNADSGADIKTTSELMIGMSGTVPTQIKIRTANHAMGKNTPRPVPMEQDTDLFKQKIRLLNESAKRARTESKSDHSGLLECVDGLLGEANALFLKNSNVDIINVDPCL